MSYRQTKYPKVRETRVYVHSKESGRIENPGFDEGGGVEEDVAAVEGVDKGGEVGDVAIGELESGVGGREGAEVAAPPHEGPYDVALLQEQVAEAAAEVAGRSRHQHFHHFLIDGGRVGHDWSKVKNDLYICI